MSNEFKWISELITFISSHGIAVFAVAIILLGMLIVSRYDVIHLERKSEKKEKK